MTAVDVLIFVEDPGAANAVVDLPGALAARGLGATVLAAGHAVAHLAAFGAQFTEVAADAGAGAVLDAHGPGLVVCGTSENPDSLGLKLVAEARRRGLANAAFVDSPAAVEYRFRGRSDDPMAFAPDWVLVPDPETAESYRALGFDAGQVVECGHPHFDRARAAGQALAARGRDAVRAEVLPGAPPGRPVVVFLAEISDGLMPGEYERTDDYTLRGRGKSDARTDIVLEEVLDALALIEPHPYCVLRLHPKNTRDEFAAYAAEVDVISGGGTVAEVVFAADLVVGMTTIVLLEAALMGCRTLSVIPRAAEADWLTAIAMGVVPAVHTRGDLRDTLSGALGDPGRPMGRPAAEVIHSGALDRMGDIIARLRAGEGSD